MARRFDDDDGLSLDFFFYGNEKAENECGNAKNMRRVMKVISFPLIGLKTIFALLLLPTLKPPIARHNDDTK